MIAVYKIPLHDAFHYSIIDKSMPHPDTLDREGDLVYAVYFTGDQKIERREDYRNGDCVLIKEFVYRDGKIAVEKETYPETGGENRSVYTWNEGGYKKEMITYGELEFTEEYIVNEAGKTVSYSKLDQDGKIIERFQANEKGDIIYFQNDAEETSYNISYNHNDQIEKISHKEQNINVVEKNYYSGDKLEKTEIYYNDHLAVKHEFTTDKDNIRTREKVFAQDELAYEVVIENDKFHGHYFQIRTVHNNRIAGFRGHARYGKDSGKLEIKYGQDGKIEELLSSNDQYIDPVLQIQFESDAYYFLEQE